MVNSVSLNPIADVIGNLRERKQQNKIAEYPAACLIICISRKCDLPVAAGLI